MTAHEESGNPDREHHGATKSDQRVERTERSFVHSDRQTRSCVTLAGVRQAGQP